MITEIRIEPRITTRHSGPKPVMPAKSNCSFQKPILQEPTCCTGALGSATRAFFRLVAALVSQGQRTRTLRAVCRQYRLNIVFNGEIVEDFSNVPPARDSLQRSLMQKMLAKLLTTNSDHLGSLRHRRFRLTRGLAKKEV